ncbi:hypothetical protein BS47DRAFT_1338700 [Hydnum rufescens UP504]|uniref:Protein kinase domain-containing protein n=1 Tax=Hydnum rufescens UP504 TaxID=1448309 RepID=A0A9P6B5I1_9AGAM|nr:hypothetical protein BS47DRAFT_1338700 [Hydnum rufescens UP504]
MDGRTIWTVYDGIKRDDSTPVSVFFFDANVSNRRNVLPLAKNALRKLRTIRHPDVLKFIDVVETDTTIYIVTERVQPLGVALSVWEGKPAASKEEWLIWGLHRIVIALAFVNDTCQSTHGNVRTDSIFISPSGEWKLGAFELLSNAKDDAAVLYTYGSLVPDLMAFAPPRSKQGNPAAVDAYELGLLLHSVFNPSHPLPPTASSPHPAPTSATRGAIPNSIFPSFKRLLIPKPATRLTPKLFLDIGNGDQAGDGTGFFAQNRLVKICASLDGFSLSGEAEKSTLLRTLKESADSFPSEFTIHKVLPSLVSALDHGGASANAILPLVIQLGKSVPPNDYSSLVLGPVVKLFASPDRGTRMALLDHLPEFVDKLDQKTVVDKIWPHLQTGFADTVAVIREATVRSISLLVPKLSDRVLNNELLRHLAKSQLDSEASIRTNTCILIGRLAPSLSTTTQRKVLIPAFSRALKDGFVHARVAGLMALMATIACYDADDLAGKVIPAMTFTLVDKEKLVRDQAVKAMELFMKRIEAHVVTMPETAIPQGSSHQAALVSSAAGAAGALAGWAMSSLGRTLASADMQTTMAETKRPVVPLSNGDRSMSNVSAPSITVSSDPSGPTPPRVKGLKLGANKQPSYAGVSFAEELEREASAEIRDAWGDGGDLMDVNADADDWTAFESAPPPQEDDAWGESLDPDPASPPPPPPAPPRTTSPASAPLRAPLRSTPLSPTIPSKLPSAHSSTYGTPMTSPASNTIALPGEWGDMPANDERLRAAGGMTTMSKEEKATEMARRREERKQRIAALKEQKKNVAKP